MNVGPSGNTILEAIQTFTGAKTFGSAGAVGKLIVAGSTSGSTILNAAAAASGTAVLPAAGGTLAILGANVFTALQTITQASANAGILASTGYSLTGSNATSMIDLAGTWNTTGTPTAIKLDITNTASNAASLLVDLKVGGSSKFAVRVDGNVGIGTTAPAQKLHVEGDILADNLRFSEVGARTATIEASFLSFDINGAVRWDMDYSGNLVPHQVAGVNIGSAVAPVNDGYFTRLLTTGNVGVGQSSPTAVLHLKAGTATASTAPLKFAAGTNLTTPEAGAMEWDGTNLFITQGDGTRKTIAYV